MKIAIVHEMLVKLWGAEKVVEALLDIFPDADLFTLIYDEKKVWKVFPKEKIKSVPKSTGRIYNLFKNQRFCLPYMPRAVEELDLSEYDLVIASSSWFAHGVITKPETKFIVYYHSPARYLWDWTNEYKKDIWFDKGIKWYILNKLFLNLRQFDVLASNRCDIPLANSINSSRRIEKYYRRKAEVLYPPVETNRFKWGEDKGYYIIISALTEFKKLEVAINWFNEMPDKKLKIIGAWNYESTLKELVKYENVEFTGPQYWTDLEDLVNHSRGLIFPWEEDFWITPVEAMSASKPVFAYRAWGLLETNIEWITWEFFDDKNWVDFIEKFEKFEKNILSWKYDKEKIREKALRFSYESFEKNLKNIINNW